jgi:hypothetical protein
MSSLFGFSPRRSNRRFALCPGYVRHRDGDRSYVTVTELMRLYGLQPGQFVAVLADDEPSYRRELLDGRIPLGPRADGMYATGRYEAEVAASKARADRLEQDLAAMERRHPRRTVLTWGRL